MDGSVFLEAKNKLKNTKQVRDFSSPQIKDEEIDINKYTALVREVDLQNWISILEDYTFKTESIILSSEEIEQLLDVNKRFKNKEKVDWQSYAALKQLENRLDKVISGSPIFTKGAFVKTSCRSPKDAVLHSDKLPRLFREYWNNLPSTDRNENGKVTALMQASRDAMKVTTASEALDLLTTSDRVLDDLEGLKLSSSPEFHIVVRQWEEIPIESEFRAFCKKGKITALSQYHSEVFFPRLVSQKSDIEKAITTFYENTIHPLLLEKAPSLCEQYVLDFAFIDGDLKKPCIIEMNPFHSSMGCLFSRYGIDEPIVQNGPFEFRILEAERTAMQVWWSTSWREILNSVN